MPVGDRSADVALAGIAGVVLASHVLHISAWIAARVTGLPGPTTSPAQGLGVLLRPTDPGEVVGIDGLHPALYWATAALLLAALAAATLGVRRAVTDHRRAVWRRPGTATRADVRRAASARALRRRARTLRPSLADPEAADVGYLLGHAHGQGVWATVEDSILLLGPPRSGKGLHVVINAILDAPGPVVATSTRPDNLHATLAACRARGPVAVFDPQRMMPDLAAGLRWSPVRGCTDPQTAMVRAAGLAAGTGLTGGGVDNGSFWEGKTRTVLQALLHAAALDDQPPTTLHRWTQSPTAAADAVRILQSDPEAADGWAESLQAVVDADPRTRDAVWHGVALSLSALANPTVLDAVTPDPGDAFDPEEFLRSHGTLHLLATGSGATASASLIAAFVEDVVETARRQAARSPGSRLDPPLLLALDEIGNLAPLPSLPTLMADGGGTGITTMPVLQSLAQARARWGEHAATAIWDASIVKVILGGASNSRDLTDLATLIGDRDEPHQTRSHDHHGRRSTQTTTRRLPTMPVDAIRTMPFGTGLVLLRTAPPIIAHLRPWTARRDLPHPGEAGERPHTFPVTRRT
ncbi:TraM recognition domain-containing protein [Euzebya pacifica]|uniref:TraM recognition domain-containing protein n=1 Tax=Euzebya pacifica TaxID=1608957 RepID=UPI000DF782EB